MSSWIEKCSKCGQDKQVMDDGGALDVMVSDNLLRAVCYGIPFYCPECGAIKFPLKPLHDLVYVWDDPVKEKIGSLYIPDKKAKHVQSYFGKVLAIGPGYYKNGKFIPTELKVGDYVAYNRSVPHRLSLEGNDGKMYPVRMFGEQDIIALVEEEGVDAQC